MTDKTSVKDIDGRQREINSLLYELIYQSTPLYTEL